MKFLEWMYSILLIWKETVKEYDTHTMSITSANISIQDTGVYQLYTRWLFDCSMMEASRVVFYNYSRQELMSRSV